LDENRYVAAWLPGLDAVERARASRFVQPQHARRFVLRRWGLRCILSGRLGVAPEAIGFAIDEFGKPWLAPPHDRAGFGFSTSHGGDLALIALRDGPEPFAIDVEKARRFDDADQLVARFFSPREQRDYAALAPAERRGLSFPLDRFDVTLAPDRPAAIMAIGGGAAENWTVQPIALGPDYRAAAVGWKLPPADDLTQIDPASLPWPHHRSG
jgi:4'-phosphopantetheinyl transferase